MMEFVLLAGAFLAMLGCLILLLHKARVEDDREYTQFLDRKRHEARCFERSFW